MENRLAIIIPYYKIDFFEETIKSIVNQRNKRFTLYIGNDASPNSPSLVLDKYLKKDEYAYFEYTENFGGKSLVKQWERILENVQEEWFQILGDDDCLSDNFVEEFYSNYNKLSDVNLYKVRPIICNAEGEQTCDLYKKVPSGYYLSLDIMLGHFGGRLNSSLSENIFRMSAFKEIGFTDYPLAWHSDDMLILKITNLGNIYFNNGSMVFIKQFERSISGNSTNWDVKSKASRLFFADMSDMLIDKKISVKKRLAFLRSLKAYKNIIGMKSIKDLYYRNSLIGYLYFFLYKLKLMFKKIIPDFLVKHIQ